MLKMYQIPEVLELRSGAGWKHSFMVGSSKNGAAPANWDDITVKGYLSNPLDYTTVLKPVAVAKGVSGQFEASLTQAEVGTLAAGNAKLIFLYMVEGDANVYALAIGGATIAAGLPAW
jgi:hypothetical protein